MEGFESIWRDLQAVPFEQGYIDAGGRRTRYLHAGDNSLPTLVLLHGSAGHAEAYVRNLDAHGEHFSTWAIDMLGHGFTDRAGHPLEVDHYVEHLLAFLDAIGADRWADGWPRARRSTTRSGSTASSSTRRAARRPTRR